MTESEGGGLVPVDSFRVRLAIVRALMGWNYEEAQAATGVGSESWRLWEKGARNCSTKTDVAEAIAQVTPYSKEWIAFGGPLRQEEAHGRPRVRRSVASNSRVSSQSSRGCVSSTRRPASNVAISCEPIAA